MNSFQVSPSQPCYNTDMYLLLFFYKMYLHVFARSFLKPLFQLFHRDKDNSPGPSSSTAALMPTSEQGTGRRRQKELSTHGSARKELGVKGLGHAPSVPGVKASFSGTHCMTTTTAKERRPQGQLARQALLCQQ